MIISFRAIFILLCFSFASNVAAAPSVSSVSGVVSHGESITIPGSGFGTKAQAAPQQYDPVDGMYTGLSNGDTIPVGVGYPWPETSGSQPVYYKTINSRGVYTAKYSNNPNSNSSAASGSGRAAVGGANYTSGDYLYASWWTFFSTNGVINNNQNKFTRFTPSGNWAVASIQWTPGIMQIFNFATEQYFLVSYGTSGDGNFSPPRNQWSRMEVLLNNTSTPYHPHFLCSINSTTVFDKQSGDPGTDGAGAVPGSVAYIHGIGNLGFDTENSGNATCDFGEIYVDNTPQRVEICAGSTWSSRTHCEIQIPTAWSASSVTATVNRGSFGASDSAYLYVVDESNTANSTGYPVTFGSEADTTAPTLSGVSGAGFSVR